MHQIRCMNFLGDATQFNGITMVEYENIGNSPTSNIKIDEAKIDDITLVTEFIEGELEKMDCPMKTVIQMNVVVDEVFSNIVRYGYKDKPGPVEISVIEKDNPHRVYVRFCDSGVAYNPLSKADPDITLSAEERDIGGLGIFMVKKTMDDVMYKYENNCNILTVMKKL